MSAAWSAASRALSLWSDASIQRVRPAAATSTNRTAAHKRNMGHSSEKRRTGAERHPLYARPAHSDCWPGLVCRHLAGEERLLGGLGRAARGFLRDGRDFEREVRRHDHRGGEPAVRRGVEDAQAHRLPLRDGPELIRATRGRWREVEDRYHDAAARRAPKEPGRRRTTGAGKRSGPDVGCEEG